MNQQFLEQIEPLAKAGFWTAGTVLLGCKLIGGELAELVLVVLDRLELIRARRRGGK